MLGHGDISIGGRNESHNPVPVFLEVVRIFPSGGVRVRMANGPMHIAHTHTHTEQKPPARHVKVGQ